MALQLHSLLIALALMFVLTSAIRTPEIGSLLLDNYDDGSEMNQRIILEFMTSEQCQRRCEQYDKNTLLNSF